jgi:hypothetical protein
MPVYNIKTVYSVLESVLALRINPLRYFEVMAYTELRTRPFN